MRIIVTGGAGFIGSNFVRRILKNPEIPEVQICNIDALTYAGDLSTLDDVKAHRNYSFHHVNILDKSRLQEIFLTFKPNAVVHFAAESHVDRSIDGPAAFIQTNIVGTFNLLEIATEYCHKQKLMDTFRFLHVSTDEVFGSLGPTGKFSEQSPYSPNSPYSASKASSDHLVRAWHHTYGLPILITNCSNNYGPYQFPEKLIPLMIINALAGKPLPIYGDGSNIRDWLYVEDHVTAIQTVLSKGVVGETYLIGGNNEISNIELVRAICKILDQFCAGSPFHPHANLIEFVTDRPGHDHRYAIDASKIRTQLGWQPKESRSSGLQKTVHWYLENRSWWQKILQDRYQGQRLGKIKNAG